MTRRQQVERKAPPTVRTVGERPPPETDRSAGAGRTVVRTDSSHSAPPTPGRHSFRLSTVYDRDATRAETARRVGRRRGDGGRCPSEGDVVDAVRGAVDRVVDHPGGEAVLLCDRDPGEFRIPALDVLDRPEITVGDGVPVGHEQRAGPGLGVAQRRLAAPLPDQSRTTLRDPGSTDSDTGWSSGVAVFGSSVAITSRSEGAR